MAEATSYIPGVCNINHAEIAYRRKAGYLGAVMFFFGLGALLLLDAPVWMRLFLVPPAILSASGFLQAKNKFCVGYGVAGQQNADGDAMTAKSVASLDAQAQDRLRAQVINRQSVLYGLAAALVTLLV